MFRRNCIPGETERVYHSRLGYAVDEACGAVKYVFSRRPINENRPYSEHIIDRGFDYGAGVISILFYPLIAFVTYCDSFNMLERVDEIKNPAPSSRQ